MGKTKKRGNGEGSIRKRGNGPWEACLTVGKNSAGNPKRRYIYGETRQEVAAKLAELQTKQAKGTLLELNRLTVDELARRWLRNKTGVTEKTRYTYERELAPVLEEIGDVHAQKLHTAQVRDAYTAMAHRDLSVRAQRRAAQHLRSVLRDGVHEGILLRNVADGVRISAPRVKPAAQAWTAEEASAFIGAPSVRSDALYPVFYVMLALGLRRGEALGLAWEDVDLERGIARVRHAAKVGQDGSVLIGTVKTINSRRTLLLTRDVVGVLSDHQSSQMQQMDHAGTAWEQSGLVFTTSIGTPLNPRNVLRSFKRLIAPLPVTAIRLHDLRHTHASLALQKGIPVEAVSERLGHARVDITLNIYRHLYDVERRAAALPLDELLGSSPRTLN